MKVLGVFVHLLSFRTATSWHNHQISNTRNSFNHHIFYPTIKNNEESYYHYRNNKQKCVSSSPTTTTTTTIWSKKQKMMDEVKTMTKTGPKPKVQNNKTKKKKFTPKSTSKTKATTTNSYDEKETSGLQPIRINKVLKEKHSRREADTLISKGKVSVNGKVIGLGHMVHPYKDKVKVAGVPIKGWERYMENDMLEINDEDTNNTDKRFPKKKQQQHEYIKYWKPKGITCSTDSSIQNNILERIKKKDGFVSKRRVIPVGRLDRDTSGLIILTSDGRVSKAVLKGVIKQPKTYKVYLDRPISTQDIQTLKNGMRITTSTKRYNDKSQTNNPYTKPRTITTNPCIVRNISTKLIEMTITDVETRNRQIHMMLQLLGYKVIKLHRINFMGIKMGNKLQNSGDWMALDESEMRLIDTAIQLYFDSDVTNDK